MKVLLFLILAVTISGAFIGKPQVLCAEKKTQTQMTTKKLMNKFLEEMTELKKFLPSESKFENPKNEKEISLHLKRLSELSEKAAHDPELSQKSFKISKEVLISHIGETERVFKSGNKHFARWMLNSTFSVCISCHMQVPARSRKLKDFELAKTYMGDFEQAEFLFATRAFDKANEIFFKIAEQYPTNNVKPDQLETALERQVAYFSRVRRDPSGGLKTFEKLAQNKSIPEFLKSNISSWIEQFKAWNTHRDLDPKIANDTEMLEFIKVNLDTSESSLLLAADNPKLVSNLKSSGFLYEYLQLNPKSKIIPQILYWISQCERSIGSNFFFSMADLYLRECIVNYPADPFAKKCYKEYADETLLSYSGSGGVHIPMAVTADLSRLKALVDSGGAVIVHENR